MGTFVWEEILMTGASDGVSGVQEQNVAAQPRCKCLTSIKIKP